jgi:hypothetical protein
MPGCPHRGGEDVRGQPGRGDQQGFLERGPVGHGRLVEDGHRGQLAAGQQPVDAQLGSGQVFLNQQWSGRPRARGGQNAADPVAACTAWACTASKCRKHP